MPRERSDRWDKLDAPLLAARQHGAIKGSQLGLSRTTISRWVDEGRLYRKYRGVYAYGHPHLAREGRWMAAVLAAGDGAALAGMSVAFVWELTRHEPREIEVLAPKRRQVPGVRVRECRNLDPRDVTVWNGIPVTTVARMLVDLTDDQPADVAREPDPRGCLPRPFQPRSDARLHGPRQRPPQPRRPRSRAAHARCGQRRHSLPARAALSPARSRGRTSPNRCSTRSSTASRSMPTGPACASRSTDRTTSAPARRSTTASATPRYAPPATPSCASAKRTSTNARRGSWHDSRFRRRARDAPCSRSRRAARRTAAGSPARRPWYPYRRAGCRRTAGGRPSRP